MKKPILVLFSVLILGAGVAYARPATTSPATASAIKLYKAGDYTQAYVRFSELVKKDPSNALAYYYLGMSSVQLGKVDEAIVNYNKAANLSPNGILGRYAKKGVKCAEDPLTCHDDDNIQKNDDTPEDIFIKGSFGSGLSEKARGVYEQQKLESIKRKMNRQEDIAPQKFRDYKDFSSQAPSNEEIADAIKTLNAAGLTNVLGSQNYSDAAYMLGEQNNTNSIDMINALFGNNRGSVGSDLNPQIIQALLTTQMTASF